MFLASKLWSTEHGKMDVEPACRKALADLGLDYLDLYLIHWPSGFTAGQNQGNVPKHPDGEVVPWMYLLYLLPPGDVQRGVPGGDLGGHGEAGGPGAGQGHWLLQLQLQAGRTNYGHRRNKS